MNTIRELETFGEGGRAYRTGKRGVVKIELQSGKKFPGGQMYVVTFGDIKEKYQYRYSTEQTGDEIWVNPRYVQQVTWVTPESIEEEA